MAGKLSKFQMVGFQHWKGTTKDNHLGMIFQRAPQKASELMVQLLAANRGKTLDSFLSQFPTKEFENDNEYYWDVIGSASRNIPLVEARDINGEVITANSPNVGIGGEIFYLVFPEDWFADGEVIVGNLNQVYPQRILGEARMEGTNAVYKVELFGGDGSGIPAERLLAGERYSIEYAPVEKSFSRKVGDVRFSAPVSMRNEWTTIRIQHKVGGDSLGKKLAVGVPMVRKDASGKQVRDTANLWMHYVDFAVEEQFREYKNNAMAFGTSNRNANGEYMNFGKSGGAIQTGAGIFEQTEVANTLHYNTFSMKLILDALYDLSASKLSFQDRHFILKTGEKGAIQFNRAAKQQGSGWIPMTSVNNPPTIEKTKASFTNNAVAYNDYQITEWRAPNGVIVTVDVDPFYDDLTRNKIMHPLGGPAMSYRYDIWYIGTMDQPNIFKCKVKGFQEARSYQWGLRNPFTGQWGNPYMSHDEDSATMHKMGQFGVCVLDPTRTMSIIPSILQG